MTFNFNKKLSYGLGVFGLFTALSVIMVITNIDQIIPWLIFITTSILLSLTIIKLWKHRNLNPNIIPGKHSHIFTEFKEKTIVFPNGYFYKYCSFRNEIKAEQISEINLNTTPPSFVFEDKEVIFVEYKYRGALENFGRQNNIAIVNRPEIWEMICEPYLDTEFDEEHKNRTIQLLIENGLTESEIYSIRKKIKNIMMFYNSFVWDWVHLGQSDYLDWTLFLTRKKYWWTMNIALRNFKKDNKGSH